MKRLLRIVVILSLSVVTTLILYQFISTANVYGESMLPTYEEGDKVIMTKLLYRMQSPQRNDIIALKDSMSEKILIKRVIAIEGDTLKITEDGDVYLNGELLNEPYIYEEFWRCSLPIETVMPEGTIFVMGDNRNVSYDSRGQLSFVGKDQIVGKIIHKLNK